ncbi:MAG TPA: UvrB/UvrC motif-containing protein [Candidatus Paceibacterota bacterium]|nr:UvrB/UvrC motif-containing protein [Candidatus Paceibacterota bacterium]
MKNELLKKLKIPDKPGVYFFLKGKDILYIGKATSLRDRVKSYFGKDLIATRGPMIVDMIFQANKIDWRTTDNVLEALILEASLIKAHQPKYNSREKSDTSFNHVSITKELFPKVLVIRGKEINFESKIFGDQKLRSIFGPFTNGGQLNEAMKIIRRIFPYIDASSSKKQNYQFYKQLGLTPDVAALHAYLQNINYLRLFFRGKKKDIIRDMKKKMMLAAKAQNFERAGELKRQLFALQHINDIALLKNENYAKERAAPIPFRIEAYDIAHMSGKNMVGVMTVVENNSVVKSEYKKFRIRTQDNANDTGALVEVLSRRLAHSEWTYPNLIVVDGGVAQINAAEAVLKSLRLNIPVASVLKDERHKPKAIKGDGELIKNNQTAILLSNSEAHRFAIAYHKKMRGKNFLKI